MGKTRRIKVQGVRREEIDTEQLALVYWLQAKRVLKERRANDQAAKAKRREIEGSREH
ncbi:MAG: hypothetical protein ACYDHN_16505 [Solirubrobacteraceae bacterium]